MAANPAPNPWIAYRKSRPGARVRLFCFPYAGGGAAVFRNWADELPEEIEVCPVQLPGREGRIRDRPFTDSGEAVRELEARLEEELERGPHALFGHSMGAVLAYELARRRRDAGRAEPVHLFVSGRPAPTEPEREDPIHDLPPERFRQRLQELNGTPSEVLEHPELMELVEPLLRADFRLVETYRYHPGPPLSCPLTAVGGVGDDHVPAERIEPWRQQTRGPYRQIQVPGDHFFLQGAGRNELLRIVARALLA